MQPKILFENEIIHLELNRDNDKLLLTSERIRHSKMGWGYNDVTSILLKEISSITVNFRSNIIFIFLAIISGLFAFITFASNGDKGFFAIACFATILMVFLYFASRRQNISIRSANGKIDYNIKGYSNDKLIELIDKIEIAIKNSQIK